MKKIIFAATVAVAGLAFAASSHAVPLKAGGGAFAFSEGIAIDTVPSKHKDSSWNRKKFPDTTHMPKRDSVRKN